MFVSSQFFIEVIVIIIAQSPFHTGIMSCLNLATMVPGTIEVFIALNQGAGVCVVATLLFRILRVDVASVALTILSVFDQRNKCWALNYDWPYIITLILATGELNWKINARVIIKNFIVEWLFGKIILFSQNLYQNLFQYKRRSPSQVQLCKASIFVVKTWLRLCYLCFMNENMWNCVRWVFSIIKHKLIQRFSWKSL